MPKPQSLKYLEYISNGSFMNFFISTSLRNFVVSTHISCAPKGLKSNTLFQALMTNEIGKFERELGRGGNVVKCEWCLERRY